MNGRSDEKIKNQRRKLVEAYDNALGREQRKRRREMIAEKEQERLPTPPPIEGIESVTDHTSNTDQLLYTNNMSTNANPNAIQPLPLYMRNTRNIEQGMIINVDQMYSDSFAVAINKNNTSKSNDLHSNAMKEHQKRENASIIHQPPIIEILNTDLVSNNNIDNQILQLNIAQELKILHANSNAMQVEYDQQLKTFQQQQQLLMHPSSKISNQQQMQYHIQLQQQMQCLMYNYQISREANEKRRNTLDAMILNTNHLHSHSFIAESNDPMLNPLFQPQRSSTKRKLENIENTELELSSVMIGPQAPTSTLQTLPVKKRKLEIIMDAKVKRLMPTSLQFQRNYKNAKSLNSKQKKFKQKQPNIAPEVKHLEHASMMDSNSVDVNSMQCQTNAITAGETDRVYENFLEEIQELL